MENLTNFDNFGYRELNIAGRLLQAYADNPVIDKDGLNVGFNSNNGYVFCIMRMVNALCLMAID